MKRHQTENKHTATQPLNNMEKITYKCVPIPGKGVGMIATRDIKSGELILEDPVMLTLSSNEKLNDLYDKFKKLSSTLQKEVMRLHNEYPIEVHNKFKKLSVTEQKEVMSLLILNYFQEHQKLRHFD